MLDGQICPDAEIADLEAQNGLIQFDAIHSLFLRFGHHLEFDWEIVCQFNRGDSIGFILSLTAMAAPPVVSRTCLCAWVMIWSYREH